MSEGTVGKLHVEIDAKLDGLQAGLTQAQKASEQTQVKMQSGWIKAADKMNATGNKLSIGLTAPLVAAGTASVAFAVQAEQSFAKVGTIVDEAVLSYEDMKKQVTDASNQTGVAVTDLNEALYESISAGVDSGKAIGFTTDMVKLAKGGFTEASKAVDVVTTVLNAYGMSADEATKVSDMLITTQNIGKTTVDELASSMGKVIPTANAYKVGLADVSTTMAVLTKNGIATAEATTYYNGMLNELGKSGSVADKALRELSGKGFQQLITDGVPVTEILQMLQTYAAGSGKSLADMFGSMEGAKAALTIMKDGGTEYNTVLKQMGDSAGATQKAFEKMDSTPMQQLQKSMNELKNASIDAGNVILPMVTNVVKSVGSLANGFSKLDPTMQKVIVGSIGIAAAAGPVLKIGAGAITTIQKIKSGIDDLKITKRTSDIVKATQATTEMAKSTVSVGTSIQTASRFTDVYGGKLTYTTAASTATAVSSTAVAGGFTSAGTASAGATVGVTAFGTALKFAFPIIGLVAVGVTTLIGVFSELSKPNEEVRKLEENTKELNKTVQDGAAKFKNTSAEVEAQGTIAKGLAGKIESLNSEIVAMNASDQDAVDKKIILKQKVDELNSIMGASIVTINGQTGAVNENVDAIKQSIDALIKQARAQAFNEDYVEMLKNQGEAEKDKIVAIEGLKKGYDALNKGTKDYIEKEYKLRGEWGALNAITVVGSNDMAAYARTVLLSNETLGSAKTEMDLMRSAAEKNGITLTGITDDTQKNTAATQENAAAIVTATDTETEAMTAKIQTGQALTDAEIAQKQAIMDKQTAGMELTIQEQALCEVSTAAEQARLQAIQEGLIVVTQAQAEALEARIANGQILDATEQAMLDQYKARQEELVASASETNRRLAEEQNISLTQQTKNVVANTELTEQFVADQDFLRSQLPGMNKYIDELSVADAKSLRANIENWDDGGKEQIEKFFAAQEAAANIGGPQVTAAVKENAKEANEEGNTELSYEKGKEVSTNYVDGEVAGMEEKKPEFIAATENVAKETKAAAVNAITALDFGSVGRDMIQDIIDGVNAKKTELYRNISQIAEGLKSRMKFNGAVSVRGGGTSASISVDWYDKGGYFTQPSFIGIAEKRPEFVGAADDLESFIGAAVNNAFVGVNPALLHDVSMPRGGGNYGGDTVYFNPTVTINTQKLTDAELRRATDFTSREFARMMSGRKVGKLQR